MTHRDRATETASEADDPLDPRRRDALKAGLAGAAGMAGLTAASRPAAARSGEETSLPLAGKAALITGAARGIGRAIGIAYARAGADVAALDIADPDAYRAILGYPLASQADLDQTVRLIEAEGRRAIGIKADVVDKSALAAAMRQTVGRFGRLDIVVANAGVGGGGRLQDLSEAHLKTVIDINLIGAANTLQAALPPMIEQASGRIIAITSVAGRMGSGGQADYAASKWGLIGLEHPASERTRIRCSNSLKQINLPVFR